MAQWKYIGSSAFKWNITWHYEQGTIERIFFDNGAIALENGWTYDEVREKYFKTDIMPDTIVNCGDDIKANKHISLKQDIAKNNLWEEVV